MNKKIFGAILAFALVLSQAVVAFAAPSGTASVSVNGNTTVGDMEHFGDVVSDHWTLSILELANKTDATDAEVVAVINATGDVNITGTVNFVTKFYNVTGAAKSADGLYHVELVIPGLPGNASTANVRGLHYSEARGIWEVVTPVSVKNGVVEFGLIDCSPLAVYTTDAATSPVTGVASSWTILMGAAVVLFAVSAFSKKFN